MSALSDLSNFEFTQSEDWFSPNIPAWRQLFAQVSTISPRALEIGTWEGRSATFTLLELCREQGSLVCIDHFDSFQTKAGQERFRKVTHNLRATGHTHRIITRFSVPGLMQLLQEAVYDPQPGFDWIYIDGSHEATDTFLDAELSWRLARKNSFIVFDDYRWGIQPEDSPHHPKPGIDAFMALHRGEFYVISGTESYQYQMVIRKTVEMSIGFSFDGARQSHLVLGRNLPVTLAFASDSTYAMPTGVAISTSVKHTPGPIRIYVLDCGLTEDDRERIQKSIPKYRSEVSLAFLDLPANSLAHTLGMVWSKIDLIKCFPVERALYLDSDTLVRKDLSPLWSTDLGNSPIAAAPDVGHPFGPEGKDNSERFPYFNAGVILMDLARVRARASEIYEAVKNMKDSHFKDQDVLNEVFRTEWLELSLRWNASGMGTYANIATPERSLLRLGDMADPCIVHFTGPVHPPMEDVVNPWVQPYLAKPWGYAGAPGHPYEPEWWKALEQTAWSGWKGSHEYKEMRNKQRAEAWEQGKARFEQNIHTIRVDQ